MGCDNCEQDIRYTCGKRINARCIDYEGEYSTCSSLNCCNKPSMHTVIEDMNSQLSDICDSLDTSELGGDCLSYPSSPILVKDVLLTMEEEICSIKNTLSQDADCNPVFDQDIACLELDYKCLYDPCGVNRPASLKELLQSMIDKICELDAAP